MKYHKFKYEYHDSFLEDIKIGPRREINLSIYINPVWNDKIEKSVKLKFSAIDNFETVKEFFENKIIKPEIQNTGIIAIKLISRKKFIIDFEVGDVEINTNKYLEI